MKRLGLLFLVVILSGCFAIRTYNVERPRVDTDLQGNRGALFGTAKPKAKKTRLGKTRKISVFEIELGPWMSKKVEEPRRSRVRAEEFIDEDFYAVSSVDANVGGERTPLEREYQEYTIKKNDTLQKVSRKFYGTTKKWKMLYEVNKDTLKSPNKVYEGMKIRVPVLD